MALAFLSWLISCLNIDQLCNAGSWSAWSALLPANSLLCDQDTETSVRTMMVRQLLKSLWGKPQQQKWQKSWPVLVSVRAISAAVAYSQGDVVHAVHVCEFTHSPISFCGPWIPRHPAFASIKCWCWGDVCFFTPYILATPILTLTRVATPFS